MGTLILTMFRSGLDTREIARLLHLTEADAERMLHRDLEAERKTHGPKLRSKMELDPNP